MYKFEALGPWGLNSELAHELTREGMVTMNGYITIDAKTRKPFIFVSSGNPGKKGVSVKCIGLEGKPQFRSENEELDWITARVTQLMATS